MRIALLALTIGSGIALASPAIASPYCDGYRTGYHQGYCDTMGQPCSGSETSSCRGERDSSDNYDAGYARGYKDGGDAVLRKLQRREERRRSQEGETFLPPKQSCEDYCQSDRGVWVCTRICP
jgi:hypothetical protein